jgi:acyl carrier protein
LQEALVESTLSAIRDHLVCEFALPDPEQELSFDTNLVTEGLLDSLGIFLLIDFLEERFGVEVPAEEITLEHFATIRSVAALVEAKLGLDREDATL